MRTHGILSPLMPRFSNAQIVPFLSISLVSSLFQNYFIEILTHKPHNEPT